MSDTFPTVTTNEPQILLPKDSMRVVREVFCNGAGPELLQMAGYNEEMRHTAIPTLNLLGLDPTERYSPMTGKYLNFEEDDSNHRCEVHAVNPPDDNPSWIHIAGVNPHTNIFHDNLTLEMILIERNDLEISPLNIFEIAMFTRFEDFNGFDISSESSANWLNNQMRIFFKYPPSDIGRTIPFKTYQIGFRKIENIFEMPYDGYIRMIDQKPSKKSKFFEGLLNRDNQLQPALAF